MSEKPNRTHVKRILIGLVVLVVLGGIVRTLLVPRDFGNHGSIFYKYYRKGAIDDELARMPRHMTNASCKSCHPWEYTLQSASKHRSLSCEFCHGPWADHVNARGELIGHLPDPRGKEAIRALCLRCHNGAIQARPRDPKVIKTVLFPDHLRKQHVREDHACDQCHLVHAPLYYINQVKEFWSSLGKGGARE
ncbi:cytochrome c3 family protein [Thermosulfurimonas sp. F29]|uniref:cytochrome c3 family protein n=1 Tax=Thermosulfurimonas sp. F29 TaxID=2867247 RepID=UPI001C82855D|nr:cytochrome c3 family protein [Thermosulfurimonas sp. F29]MBX6422172.1 cytochrome c3 family protein [Thermosulfurimonas sp. F29]